MLSSTSDSESEDSQTYLEFSRVVIDGLSSNEGSTSHASRSTSSPGVITGVVVALFVVVTVIVALSMYCIVKKKRRNERRNEGKNAETELSSELIAYDSTHSSDESDEATLNQTPQSADSMLRFMDSQEQEANSYTKYDNQKPYLE